MVRMIGHFDPEILKRYEDTLFMVKNDAGELLPFRVKDWDGLPVHGLKKQFCILTASNPMNETKSAEENKKQNERLEEALKNSGYVYYRTADAATEGQTEAAFTVEGMPAAEAKALGGIFRQYAVLCCDEKGPIFLRC